MDPLEEKLQAIIAEWEQGDPGSTDIEQPPREPDELPDLPPPGEMRLPEMDFSGEDSAPQPPPAAEALVRKDASSTSAIGGPSHEQPPRVDPKTLDWKGLSDNLRNAELRQMQSKAGDRLRANAGESGAFRVLPRGDEQLDLARQPLGLAKEKQGMEARDLGMQSQRNALGVKDAMDNPNSLQSQKAREAWKAFGLPMPPGFDGWSANEVQRNIPGAQNARKANIDEAQLGAKRAEGEKKAAGEKSSLENSRKAFASVLTALGIDPATASQKDIDRAISVKHAMANEAIARAGNARAETPKLPPGQLAEVADYKTAAKVADDLLADFEAADLGGILNKAAGKVSEGTGLDLGSVSQYNDKANTAAQTIGLALEGGKLGEADLPRYKAMMPQPGDSPARARAKRDNIKRALADKAAGRSIEWLKAGYKVPSDDVPSGQSSGAKIRVRRKSDGKAGSLLPKDFDETKYERI